jgi:hypothetical protein
MNTWMHYSDIALGFIVLPLVAVMLLYTLSMKSDTWRHGLPKRLLYAAYGSVCGLFGHKLLCSIFHHVFHVEGFGVRSPWRDLTLLPFLFLTALIGFMIGGRPSPEEHDPAHAPEVTIGR